MARLIRRVRLLLGAGTLSTAFCLLGPSRSITHSQQQARRRSFLTAADKFYSDNEGQLPAPVIAHSILSKAPADDSKKGILVIGDVHGCITELNMLHEAAIAANDDTDFQHVILVGDLVNKGPSSAQVVQQTRLRNDWLAVRGNHDNGALAAAVAESNRPTTKRKYKWICDLTDDDVAWMTELPYSIRIPASYWGNDSSNENKHDYLIVHAALVPGLALEKQQFNVMTNGRHAVIKSSVDYEVIAATKDYQPVPWASVWNGPEHVVFGHDALRGLQEYDHATGLDTGACYGGKLTALMLPQRKLVSVDALEVYCPTG